MDAIESLEWGAYAHFSQKAAEQPNVLRFMEIAYYLSDYVAIGFLFSLAALLFVLQGKHRGAQLTAASLAVAVAVIFALRFWVPRMRPPAAQGWVGVNDMQGSYPSAAVFLFMLAMILIGVATWGPLRHWWRQALYTLIASLLTVWVFFSQFYLALGFLTDMLGGMAGAAAVALTAIQFMNEGTPAPAVGKLPAPEKRNQLKGRKRGPESL